eukprot:TRINITY_DN24885_c0_g1_i1.p1 TRINITY_DN24885_c0_g1~~TRINITY_DN24885_c0_g1_i1.p1  ORF type:complete len:729 (+),score=163.07 TRINITY_DN24885_c0_g1_i1:153-2339(+)
MVPGQGHGQSQRGGALNADRVLNQLPMVDTADESAVDKAKRSLEVLSGNHSDIQPTDDNLKIVLAFQALRPTGRISAKLLRACQAKQQVESALTMKVLVVPKASLATTGLPSELRRIEVQPGGVVGWLPGVRRDSVHLLDFWAAQSKLHLLDGVLGIAEHSVKMSSTTGLPDGGADTQLDIDSAGQPPHAQFPPASTSSSSSSASNRSDLQSDAKQEVVEQEPKLLAKQEVMEQEDAFEGLAKRLKLAIGNGVMYSENKVDKDTVESAIAAFVLFAKRETGVGAEQPVKEYMMKFVGVACTALLKHSCLDGLPYISTHFESLQKTHKDYADADRMETRLLKAVIGIAAAAKGGDAPDLSYLEPGECLLVSGSVLHGALAMKHRQTQFDELKGRRGEKTTGAVRLADVKKMQKLPKLDTKLKSSLDFAEAMLSEARGACMARLLKAPDDFALLAAWFGKDESLMQLQLATRTSFKEIGIEDFLKIADMIMPEEQAMKAVKNPVLKQVLYIGSKTCDLLIAGEAGKACPRFTRSLLKELAVSRLGVSCVLDAELPEGFSNLAQDVLSAMARLVKLKTPNALTGCPILTALATQVAEKPAVPAQVAEKPAGNESVAAPSGSQKETGADAQPAGGNHLAGNSTSTREDDLVEGEEAYCIHGKHDGMKVKVLKIMQRLVKFKVVGTDESGQVPKEKVVRILSLAQPPSKKQKTEADANAEDAARDAAADALFM